MRTLGIFALFLAVQDFALAQLDDNTLTVTGAANLNSQPDQAVVNVLVSAPQGASLDYVLGVLKGTGITAENLSSNITPNIPSFGNGSLVYSTTWIFSLRIPFSKLTGEFAKLDAALQSGLESGNSSVSYSVSSGVSDALIASQACPFDQLVAQARAQAQKIAAAAQVGLGPITSVVQETSNPGQVTYAALLLPTAASRAGDFVLALSANLIAAPVPRPASPQCTLSVQFRLIH